MTSPDPAPRVLYLHGLESGPQAGKVVVLRAAGFETRVSRCVLITSC